MQLERQYFIIWLTTNLEVENIMLKFFLAFFIIVTTSLVQAMQPADLNKENDKRIVVLEFSLLDNLNLLGVKPVGIGTSGGTRIEGSDPEYLHSIIISTPSVGAREAPNLEAISSLKPDLIIGDIDFNHNIKAQLEKIAPTILLKGIFGSPEQQITNIKLLADLTQTKADAVIATYHKIYAQAQTVANKTNKTKMLIGFPTTNNSFNALANNSITTQILATLGKENMITQNTASQLYELSVEGLLAMNPEQIVILFSNNDHSAYLHLQKNPLWQQLNAVKNNKVYFADRNIWGKSHGIQALELMYQQGIQSGFLANTIAKNQ